MFHSVLEDRVLYRNTHDCASQQIVCLFRTWELQISARRPEATLNEILYGFTDPHESGSSVRIMTCYGLGERGSFSETRG
jgi:hypothetical protein